MHTIRTSLGGYSPAANVPVARVTDSAVTFRPFEDEQPSADALSPPVASRATIRVLVIDDDRTLREGCASVLQVEGFNVTTSGRGDEALELFRRTRFDIVMVDL